MSKNIEEDMTGEKDEIKEIKDGIEKIMENLKIVNDKEDDLSEIKDNNNKQFVTQLIT
jgi:hypothetical protein